MLWRCRSVSREDSSEGSRVRGAIWGFRRWLGYQILPGTDADHVAQARFLAQCELNRAYRETGEPALGEAYRMLDRYVPVRPVWNREHEEVEDA